MRPGYRGCQKSHQEEISTLQAQILELKQSQDFVCAEYHDMKTEYEKLKTKSKEEENELNTLRNNKSAIKKNRK